MSGVTNQLLIKTKKFLKIFQMMKKMLFYQQVNKLPLIAGKLKELGYNARSWLGWQLPIITKGNYSSSRIIKIQKTKIINYLKEGGIPIITGFQGINSEFRVTTLERGGSIQVQYAQNF